MPLRIQTIVSSPFDENSYVAWLEGSSEAVVVDPGFEPDLILDFCAERKLTLAAILNTHGHADHIAGNAEMKRAFPAAPLVIGVNDAPLLTDPALNVSRMFGYDLVSPPAEELLHDGDDRVFAGMRMDIREIPGHSPGHVVFILPEHGVVFGGDVLFRESIGRTDFPGGSFATLAKGIRSKLYGLPPQTVVYPGHGPETTIGHERANNPFVADA